LLSGKPPKVSMFQLNLTEITFTLNLNLDQAVSRMEQSVQSTQSTGISGNELLAKLELLFAEQQKHRVKAQITDYKLYANPAIQITTGLLILFMMGLINSSVAVIMEDRKQRTMARIFTAPVRAFEIALGNFMGSFMIGFLQIATVLAVTRYIMGFDYGLPFFVHLTILLCFMLAALGISTTVAGLAKNSNIMGLINTIVVTPTCMIGGCFWPIWIMPSFMQKLANIVPQKWAIEALENISSGQSLFQNRIEISVLILFAIILLGFGSFILKPNEAESY
jgi:ABC-2 type transport system permease protein